MKCVMCNKKISIADEITCKCKCSMTFCSKHKFYIMHNCQYNYRIECKEQLRMINPICINEKVNKI